MTVFAGNSVSHLHEKLTTSEDINMCLEQVEEVQDEHPSVVQQVISFSEIVARRVKVFQLHSSVEHI